MFRRTFAAAVVGLCLTVGTGTAGVVRGPVRYNGHTYYLLTESTWGAAQATAVALGGNLVTITDAAEQAFVYGTFGNSVGADRMLWIGLNDVAVEGTFVWVSGEPVTYTNWFPGEPNNANGSEDYGHMFDASRASLGVTPGTWNDASRVGTAYGVVEVIGLAAVPEPASAVLLAAGGLAVAAAARRRRGRA